MKHILALVLSLFALGAAAQAPACWPPPIDTAGKGAVHGTVNGVEWSAWWCVKNFDWARVHWYRLPGATVIAPAPGASGVKDYAISLWNANIKDRGCTASVHPEAVPACNAMFAASSVSRPPDIWYDVAAATSKDGTRPGYKLSSTGTLVADGTRHLAGSICDCPAGSVKPSSTQYCLVYKTTSYAACVRVQ